MTSRHQFTLNEKIGIIGRLENGEQDAVGVAAELGTSPSTISGIWSRRDWLKSAFETKSRVVQHKDLERAVLGWYKEQRSTNSVLSISGPCLQAKTDELADGLKIENFKCSAHWILRFRQRHNISFGQLAGELPAAASVVKTKVRCGRNHDDVWPDNEDDWSAAGCCRGNDDDFEQVFAIDDDAIDAVMETLIANNKHSVVRSRHFF